VTVRVAEPLLPAIVALIVAVVFDETFFPFTVADAAEFSPVEVTVVDAVMVAPPETNHDTVRPWSGRWFASKATAVAVVVAFALIVLDPSVTTTLATVPFVTVIVELPDFPLLVAVTIAWPTSPPVTVTLSPDVAESAAILASLVVHVIV
jgi:hypothetical protein